MHVILVKAQVVDALLMRMQIRRCCHGFLYIYDTAVLLLLLQSLVYLALLLLQLICDEVAIVHRQF